MCPDNILTAAVGDETNISWPEPIFTDSLGFELNITSIFDANTTSSRLGRTESGIHGDKYVQQPGDDVCVLH